MDQVHAGSFHDPVRQPWRRQPRPRENRQAPPRGPETGRPCDPRTSSLRLRLPWDAAMARAADDTGRRDGDGSNRLLRRTSGRGTPRLRPPGARVTGPGPVRRSPRRPTCRSRAARRARCAGSCGQLAGGHGVPQPAVMTGPRPGASRPRGASPSTRKFAKVGTRRSANRCPLTGAEARGPRRADPFPPLRIGIPSARTGVAPAGSPARPAARTLVAPRRRAASWRNSMRRRPIPRARKLGSTAMPRLGTS